MIFAPFLPFWLLLAFGILLVAFAIFCASNKGFRKAKIFRRITISALLLLALMRPAIGLAEVDREISNYNIFFVVDSTGSMTARDMDSETKYRYEKASEDMKKIVNLFPGAKYSIFTLDYTAYQAMPLINSADTAISYIDTLSPKNSYLASDSNLSELLNYTYEHIEKYSKRFPERSNFLFVFSDGEDTNNRTSVPSKLGSMLNGGAVIGYGSTSGSVIYRVDYDNKITSTQLIDPATGSAHISMLNESNLKAMADSLALPYYRRSSSDDKFSTMDSFKSLNASYRKDSKNAKIKNDLYWIPMLIAIIMMLFELLIILENLLLERKVAK